MHVESLAWYLAHKIQDNDKKFMRWVYPSLETSAICLLSRICLCWLITSFSTSGSIFSLYRQDFQIIPFPFLGGRLGSRLLRGPRYTDREYRYETSTKFLEYLRILLVGQSPQSHSVYPVPTRILTLVRKTNVWHSSVGAGGRPLLILSQNSE